jgi:hypothetical protein
LTAGDQQRNERIGNEKVDFPSTIPSFGKYHLVNRVYMLTVQRMTRGQSRSFCDCDPEGTCVLASTRFQHETVPDDKHGAFEETGADLFRRRR